MDTLMTTRVAIVEDNAALLRIVSGWIESTPSMALAGAYDTAEAAIKELVRQKPDVVLVDINLPGLDGIECVRKLKPQLPTAQFVMVTVYEDVQRIFQALAAGATGYLLKRATREQLLSAIDDVRKGGSPMSAEIARKIVESFQEPARPATGASPGTADEALSPREREVLELLSQGLLYKEIAAALDCKVYTINSYVRRIYEKLHVHSRSQAIAKFLKR